MLYFPLPYSSYKPKSGPITLTTHSRLVLESLLAVLAAGDSTILLGEQTYQSPGDTTARLMESFLLARGMEKQNIRATYEARNNTWQQLVELKKQINNEPVTLIAFQFHAPRVALISKRLGLSFTIVLVEDILKKNFALEETVQVNKKVLLYEYLLRLVAYVDVRGTLQNFYTNRFGPRAPLA
jgi:vancomycin permeability regulator SanA